MTTVRSHHRIVGGRRQKVRRHKRRQPPAILKASMRTAVKAAKRKRTAVAIACGTAAVGGYAAWGLWQAGHAALTTAGMVALVAGYTIHRRRMASRQRR